MKPSLETKTAQPMTELKSFLKLWAREIKRNEHRREKF